MRRHTINGTDTHGIEKKGVPNNEYTTRIKYCANTRPSYRQPTDQFEILLNAVNNGRYTRPELLERGLCACGVCVISSDVAGGATGGDSHIEDKGQTHGHNNSQPSLSEVKVTGEES